MTELRIGVPNEKQRRFLLDRHRHIAYGGARGGGKAGRCVQRRSCWRCGMRGIKLFDRAKDTAGIAEQSY